VGLLAAARGAEPASEIEALQLLAITWLLEEAARAGGSIPEAGARRSKLLLCYAGGWGARGSRVGG
jgi:hypothetical protein